MKKITDFIVENRYLVLVIFIILTIISAVLANKVNINYDIAKYLPDTSETRIGMNIMEEEFDELNGSLNIMFKDLTEDEKNEIYNYLVGVEGVESVNYENTEEYNKDNYTLYEINVDDLADSQQAKNVYNEITEKYEDYEIETSGSVAERNKPVLHLWIILLAIACALVILIIMCESYAEPFLFLAAILMAVLLNKGTNIIFSSVSHITDAICAILQMALSMDYSIMLIDRYRQEKEQTTNKVEAMKNALYNAFKSISSSSATTIVGLLALVFMSFKIGKDLGFVLAKGVLFSLICIFFVLPALILMFDRLIEKTRKRTPNIKLDLLGKFSNKIRYIAIPIFILVFIFSYLEKGNLGILYTSSEQDKVGAVFPENNQIAIIYRNQDEEKIASYLSELEQNEKMDEVLAYGNTINQKLKYNELTEKLNSLGEEVSIEDYLLQILYYNYYNPEENNTMTFSEFTTFIKNDVYKNQNISKNLDTQARNNIDRLENFTNNNLINKKRNASEIASILEIDQDKVDDILVYYNSKNNNLKLSASEFINFMNNTVLTDEEYSKNITPEIREDLNKISKFTNTTTIQKKMTYKEMADLFGIKPELMSSLYTYYISVNEIDTKLTINQFSNFVLNDLIVDNNYKNMFDEETINNMKVLNLFSNKETISKNMNSKQISELLGFDSKTVEQLLFLKYSNTDNGSKLSVSEFINTVVYINNNTEYLKDKDLSSIEQLSTFAKNEGNINTTKLNKQGLAKIFDNVSQGLVQKVYAMNQLPDEYKMTPQEFVNSVVEFVSNPQVDVKALGFDEKSINNLKLLKLVIDDSVATNKTKYTATELSKVLNIDKTQMYNLYALIDLTQGNTSNWKSTLNEFVNLILANTNNENVKNSINEELLGQLKLFSNIMDSTIKNRSFTYKELASFIGISDADSKNIYSVYVSKNTTLKLTPQEFVKFVLANQKSEVLASNMDKATLNSLTLVQKVMQSTINNTKFTSTELSQMLGIDIEELNLVYGLYNYKNVATSQTISVKDFITFLKDDVMKNDKYSSNFDDETSKKVNTVDSIINASINNVQYSKDEIFAILSDLTNSLDKNTVDLLYIYYGSSKDYNEEWTITIEQFINYLNEDILTDSRFEDFIDESLREDITGAKDTINDAKKMLIGENYSRVILNTKFEPESQETFEFIQQTKDALSQNIDEVYVIGDSPMAYEMSKSFDGELNFITVLTMIAIFVVVAITFKSIIVPVILVLTIQCAVYLTMGILSFTGEGVYFISLLIVQSILMGATIDYAILYTSYYIEHRKVMGVKDSIINSYNKSINTIITSASILIIVTLIVGNFASAIAAKICKTISEGTMCSVILILLLLPAVIAMCDKLVMRKNK